MLKMEKYIPKLYKYKAFRWGETTVNKNPKRVVVFDYGILDSLDKLGVELIIGVVQDGIPEYLSKYASEEYSNEAFCPCVDPSIVVSTGVTPNPLWIIQNLDSAP